MGPHTGRVTGLDLFDTTMVGLQRAMSGSLLRQQVLANNLANANTPGFKRSDVDFHGALEQAFSNQPDVQAVSATGFSIVTDRSTTMRADGNNVDVDAEMSNLSENTLDYQSLTSVLRSRIGILETAIGQVR
jgi:flagellar basal-body rod protein FlgB